MIGAPPRPTTAAQRESFWCLVHAEWTKFRTVRGWVIAVIVAILVVPVFLFVVGGSSSCHASGSARAAACPGPVTGPGGEPVNDAFYFVHLPVTGNGTITVQVTSLTGQQSVGPNQMVPGLAPWSKAGIIIKEDTSQGSAYAAMMVTGSNGVRMQWDYVSDTPGLAGSVSASSPRWLRLVRDGDTITGSDSADGTHWTRVGTAALPGLTSTVQAGLFAAGTGSENPTVATGVFRHVGLSWRATGWTGTNVGGFDPNGAAGPGTFRQSADTITVTGYGDISPQLSPQGVVSIRRALDGTALGLIPLIVVGAMFMTAEYRRGLIRVSLAAAPRRSRLLAAKAVVIGAVSFVAGLITATITVTIGLHTLGTSSEPLWPVSALTLVRIIVGTGLLLAVAAVLALAIGTIRRRSASAVATAIVLLFVPYLLAIFPPLQPGPANTTQGGGLPLVWRDMLLRITPDAGFSIQQAVARFPQVTGVIYTPNWGYDPLAPWAGFAVECVWAAAALALAFYLLRKRDA